MALPRGVRRGPGGRFQRAGFARRANKRGKFASGGSYNLKIPVGRSSPFRKIKGKGSVRRRRAYAGAALSARYGLASPIGHRPKRKRKKNPGSRGYAALIREVRTLNRGKRKKAKRSRGGRWGGFKLNRSRRRNARRSYRRRRNDYLLMSNPRRRGRRLNRSRRGYRRKRNDWLLMSNPRRRRNRLARRRNPGGPGILAGIKGMASKERIVTAAWTLGGVAISVAAPAAILGAAGLGAYNSGITGLAAKAVIGGAAAALVGRFAGANAGAKLGVGVMVGVLAQALIEFAGPSVASQALPGVAGMAGLGYGGPNAGEAFGPLGRALAFGSGGMHGMGDFLESGAPVSAMGGESF